MRQKDSRGVTLLWREERPVPRRASRSGNWGQCLAAPPSPLCHPGHYWVDSQVLCPAARACPPGTVTHRSPLCQLCWPGMVNFCSKKRMKRTSLERKKAPLCVVTAHPLNACVPRQDGSSSCWDEIPAGHEPSCNASEYARTLIINGSSTSHEASHVQGSGKLGPCIYSKPFI